MFMRKGSPGVRTKESMERMRERTEKKRERTQCSCKIHTLTLALW